MDTKDKVRLLRKERKLTQKRLASISGVSEITIRKIESGANNPKIETLQKIANGLNVNLSEVMDDSIQRYIFGDKLKALSDNNDLLLTIRENFSLSLEYLSAATGIDIDRYKKIEDHSEKATEDEIKKIYSVLESNGLNSYDVYLNSHNNMSMWISRKEKLLNYFDLLNKAGQEEAVRDIEKLSKIPEYQK